MSSIVLTEKDHKEINLLAQQYSQTKKEEYITELVKKMSPICERDAAKWSKATGVPKEDLFSAYLEAVHEAAKDFKPIGLFIKRYHYFKNGKGNDVVRYYRYEKRDLSNEVPMTAKMPMETSSNEDENLTFSDLNRDRSGDFTALYELQQTVLEFKKKQPKFGTIIEKLAKREPYTAISDFLGEDGYNDFTRKQVSLARKAFREFLKQ